MRAGDLREFITIQKLTTTKNEYAESVPIWEDSAMVRAAVDTKDGRIKYNAVNALNANQIAVTIRNTIAVSTDTNRIVLNGEIYRLISVNLDRKNQTLNLIGELLDDNN